MNKSIERNAGSFRDPKGHIYELDGQIYRSISEHGIADYEYVKASGVFDKLITARLLLSMEEVNVDKLKGQGIACKKVLRHPRLDYISYPYEWSFSTLKAAAIHHLEVQILALDSDVVLSDASAYNIQFQGSHPAFIDHLSFRAYQEGEFWLGHRQYCEQFLAPLVLQSTLGVAHHAWYRGALEGINLRDLAKVLPFKAKLSPTLLMNVILPAWFENSSNKKGNAEVSNKISKKRLPKTAYISMLHSLKDYISSLKPSGLGNTVWKDYAQKNSYRPAEADKKKSFIEGFVRQDCPHMLLDIGCNTGEYSQVALDAGAQKVIGFEFDLGALELSYQRAREYKLDFLPLYCDLANPGPSQGWRQKERQGFIERSHADGIIALALIHHLCIGRNIPLEDVINWLLTLAPSGVIEFVPKQDPMVQELLQLREDIFYDYTQANFEKYISRVATIEKSEVITDSGRLLIWFHQ